MSKNGLFLTSFVAAIPGAFLAYLMVMAFVNSAGGPSVWVKGLSAVLLLIGALLAFMPVGIILFAGPKAEKAPLKPKDESGEADSSAAISASDAVSTEDDDLESDEAHDRARAGATDPTLEVVDAEGDDFAMTGEVVTGDADEEDFDLGPDSEFEMEAAEGEFADEDDGPKKGKKK